MVKYYVIKYVVPFILLILSCDRTAVIDRVSFSSNIYSPVIIGQDYLFLSNVVENNSGPCVINLSKKGEVNWIYAIDSYDENIPDYPYYRLINNQGRGVLLYKFKTNRVHIYDLITRNNIDFKEIINNSYISIFQTEDSSILIKSGYAAMSEKFKGYTVSLYYLDNNLDIEYKGRIELSSYPLELSYFGDYLFYYDDFILFRFDIRRRALEPHFKFDNEITNLKVYKGNIYLLTTNELFVFNKEGELSKSFTFNTKDQDVVATEIIFDGNRNIIKLTDKDRVELLTINSFSNSYINTKVHNSYLLDNFIIEGDKITYIKDSHLHMRRF